MVRNSVVCFILIMMCSVKLMAENIAPSALTYTIRYGQGGFSDSRSPEGGLGGGQLAFDINSNEYPLSLSFSSEFYTNSPEPTHPYEISDLVSVSLLYKSKFMSNDRFTIFSGAGFGKLKVPESELNPGNKIEADAYSVELGLLYRFGENFGFYGVLKHLRSDNKDNVTPVVDFDESIFLLGLSYEFSL